MQKASDLISCVAQKEGISVEACTNEIKLAIEHAKNNPDPECQNEFYKLFPNKTPSPEEFIFTMIQHVKK